MMIEKTSLPSDRDLAAHFLVGEGIEIGALNLPLKLDGQYCKVQYVDRLPTSEAREKFPELEGQKLAPTDVICDVSVDGLKPFASGSLDFVVACHILEHLPNPLGFIQECHRVLRNGGILYLAVPDKDYTFDKDREVTPLVHLISDFKNRVAEVGEEHLVDFLIHAAKVVIPQDPRKREELFKRERNRSIHVHVFRWLDVAQVLRFLMEKEKIIWVLADIFLPKPGITNEVIFVLQKTKMKPPGALSFWDKNLEKLVAREELFREPEVIVAENKSLRLESETLRSQNLSLNKQLAGITGSKTYKFARFLQELKHRTPLIKDF